MWCLNRQRKEVTQKNQMFFFTVMGNEMLTFGVSICYYFVNAFAFQARKFWNENKIVKLVDPKIITDLQFEMVTWLDYYVVKNMQKFE